MDFKSCCKKSSAIKINCKKFFSSSFDFSAFSMPMGTKIWRQSHMAMFYFLRTIFKDIFIIQISGWSAQISRKFRKSEKCTEHPKICRRFSWNISTRCSSTGTGFHTFVFIIRLITYLGRSFEKFSLKIFLVKFCDTSSNFWANWATF